MKTITLRNIPPEIQEAIRERATQKRISASRAVLELLRERVMDLDSLAGSWTLAEGRAFEKALKAQRKIDDELWR